MKIGMNVPAESRYGSQEGLLYEIRYERTGCLSDKFGWVSRRAFVLERI